MAKDADADSLYVTPRQLADMALKQKESGTGNIGVAYTYNEPLVGWEYVRDTARIVKEYGMVNVLVTNGTASPEILEALLPCIDAMNIDLKGFRADYYRMLGGDFDAVKAFIARAVTDCHVELTTLIVPGENDSPEEMEEEARWIAELNPEIPLHITRFFPQYRMLDRNPTDIRRLYRLAETAGKYLTNVHVGNV